MSASPDRLNDALANDLELLAQLAKRVALRVRQFGHMVAPAHLARMLDLADRCRAKLERAGEPIERAAGKPT